MNRQGCLYTYKLFGYVERVDYLKRDENICNKLEQLALQGVSRKGVPEIGSRNCLSEKFNASHEPSFITPIAGQRRSHRPASKKVRSSIRPLDWPLQ